MLSRIQLLMGHLNYGILFDINVPVTGGLPSSKTKYRQKKNQKIKKRKEKKMQLDKFSKFFSLLLYLRTLVNPHWQ